MRPFARFGEALLTEMKQAGIVSQGELSRCSSLERVEINNYATGRRLPTLVRFAALTRAGLDPIPLLAALDEIEEEKK